MLRPAAIAGVEPTIVLPEERLHIPGPTLRSHSHTPPHDMSQNGGVKLAEHHGTEDVDSLYPDPPKPEYNDDPLPLDTHRGLFSPRAFFFLIFWYIFSAFTLFQNKYILSSLPGDPTMLSECHTFIVTQYGCSPIRLVSYHVGVSSGTMQMVMTGVCGFIQLYFPCGMYRPVKREGHKPPNFYKYMILVGSLR